MERIRQNLTDSHPLIGFPVWYGDKRIPADLLSSIRGASFDYIELSLDYPWPFKDVEGLNRILREARELELKIAIHAPWRDIKLASPIEPVRRASIEVCEKALRAVGNNFEYVVIHLTTDQAVNESQIVREEAIDATIDSLRELTKLSRELGHVIVMENVRESVNQIEILTSAVPDVLLCLDIGHLIARTIKIGGEPREELAKWARKLADRTVVVHWSGVDKRGRHVVDHLPVKMNDPLTRLVIDMTRELRTRYVLLEVFYRSLGGEEIGPNELAEVVRHLKSS